MDCMALSKWIRWLYFYGLGGSATMEYSILDLKEETVLYVTHKYFDETLKKFDCILVFKQGRIVEQGSFEELMKNKEYFYSLKNKGCI